MAKLPSSVSRTSMTDQANALATGDGRGLFGRIRDVFKPGGYMSPGEPLPPSTPPDAQAEAPRAFEYRVGRNFSMRPRSDEPGLTAFGSLRSLADTFDIARIAIEEVKRQVSSQSWDIVSRAVMAGDRHAPQPNAARVEEIRRFFLKPDRVKPFGLWVKEALEETLVIDALAINKRRTLGGKLGALEVVAGDTIKCLVDSRGRTPQAPAPAYQQVMYGQVFGEFSVDQIYYAKLHPRASSAYGQSPLEWVALAMNSAIRKQMFELAYYTDGNIPDAIIPFPADRATAEQVALVQTWLDSQLSGDDGARHRIVAMPFPAGTSSAFNPYEFRKPNWERNVEEWVLKIVCAGFGVAPAEIGFLSDVNRATSQGQENAQTRKLLDVRQFLADIFNEVIEVDFDEHDLMFAWQEAKAEEDKLALAQADQILIESGQRSLNELRERDGFDPLQDEAANEPFVLTSGGPVLVRDIAASSGLKTQPPPAPVLPGDPAGKVPDKADAKAGDVAAAKMEMAQLGRYLAKSEGSGRTRRPFRPYRPRAGVGEGDRSDSNAAPTV